MLFISLHSNNQINKIKSCKLLKNQYNLLALKLNHINQLNFIGKEFEPMCVPILCLIFNFLSIKLSVNVCPNFMHILVK